MTLEQLKERVEATCNKNGIFPERILVDQLFNDNTEVTTFIRVKQYVTFNLHMPSADLLLEAVDLECRAIKARQGIATNGID